MKKTVILVLTLTLAALLIGCAALPSDTVLTKSEAIGAVYGSIGIAASDATYTVVTENSDAASPVYDVEIAVDGVVYRYRVDAAKGDFLKITVNNQEVFPEDVPKANVSGDAEYIGLDAAKAIAFADASASEGDILHFEYKMDYALGKYLYDMEFDTADTEYEYEIDAVTGEIFKKDIDGRTVITPSDENSVYIDVTAAEDAALAHAGKERASAIFEVTKWKMKKGAPVYDVEFVSGGAEYEYTVNALTGAVISFSREGSGNADERQYIGEAAALEAAFAHAGLDAETARVLSVEADVKNGKTVYEIEFKADGYEYEYEIDAVTGEVLDREKERD